MAGRDNLFRTTIVLEVLSEGVIPSDMDLYDIVRVSNWNNKGDNDE